MSGEKNDWGCRNREIWMRKDSFKLPAQDSYPEIYQMGIPEK